MTPEIIEAIQFGALAGIVAGLVPFLVGFYHGRISLAFQGLLGTILLGIYAGWLLSLPGAVYSTWRIIHDTIVSADDRDLSVHTRMLRN